MVSHLKNCVFLSTLFLVRSQSVLCRTLLFTALLMSYFFAGSLSVWANDAPPPEETTTTTGIIQSSNQNQDGTYTTVKTQNNTDGTTTIVKTLQLAGGGTRVTEETIRQNADGSLTYDTQTTLPNGQVETNIATEIKNADGSTTTSTTLTLANGQIEKIVRTSIKSANGTTTEIGTNILPNGQVEQVHETITPSPNENMVVRTLTNSEGQTETTKSVSTKNGNSVTTVTTETGFNGQPLPPTTTTITTSGNTTVETTNGQCGSANGSLRSTPPTADLCAVGTASAVSGAGPWYWSCAGIDLGSAAQCYAHQNSSIFLSQEQLAQPITESQAVFLLNRVGFAPTQAEVNTIVGMPLGQAIYNIVYNANALDFAQPLPSWAPWTSSNQNGAVVLENDYQTYNEKVAATACASLNFQSITNNCTNFKTLTSSQIQQMDVAEISIGDVDRGLFRDWWASQLVLTKYPLAERMVLFWHNLFPATDEQAWMSTETDLSIRNNALGNFESLVRAMVCDANILLFLGQNQSTPTTPVANMARETMELFTIGIDGGYTQNDVDAAAYALTGLNITNGVGYFNSSPAAHASGLKTILGQTGNWNPDDFITILFTPSSTNRGPGPYIAGKLWAEFVSSDPQNHVTEINAIADTFQNNKWAIRPLLFELFTTQAFWAPSNFATLVKSPAEFITGIVRSDLDRAASMYVGSNVPSATGLANMSTTASNSIPKSSYLVSAIWGSGEPIWMPPNVKGFLTGINWVNTSTLVNRQYNELSILITAYYPELVEPRGIDLTKILLTPQQYVQLVSNVVRAPPMLVPPPGNLSFIDAVAMAFGDPAYWLK